MRIPIICGPTSSGKTSLGVNLCKRLNGEIISADSRQIYKHMDIGTGKLPINTDVSVEKHDKYWVIDGIKIWGYDLVTPDSFFSGVDFAEFGLDKAREIIEQGKLPIIVGGTGFYIDLFTGKTKPSNVRPNFKLRSELEKLSLIDLQKKLTSLNPKALESVDEKNPVRIIRAIEKEIGKEKNTTPLPYLNTEYLQIGLIGSRELLYKRADIWTEKIWKNGLVEETKELIDLGFADSRKLSGLVYKSAVAFIHKELTEEEAIERIKFDIHAYIRRQQTYFKKNSDIKWLDISKGTDELFENVYNVING